MKKRDKMIYFAHAICTYGSEEEEELIEQIKNFFPDLEIVNPGSIDNIPETMLDGMEFYKRVVNKCDILIFSRLNGKVTSGVGIEINHALLKKKTVYEIKKKKLFIIKKPIKYLSRDDTIRLYDKWRGL